MPIQGKERLKYQINQLEMRNRRRNKQYRINKFRIAFKRSTQIIS